MQKQPAIVQTTIDLPYYTAKCEQCNTVVEPTHTPKFTSHEVRIWAHRHVQETGHSVELKMIQSNSLYTRDKRFR